jgi:hypothetical protein
MQISNLQNSGINMAAAIATKNESINEGNKPDGDHDADDQIQATAVTTTNSVGTAGSLVNTIA